MKRMFGCMGRGVIFMVLVGVIAFFASSLLGVDKDTFTVESEVLIMQDANFTVDGETCTGTGDFAGVTGGATITITTDDGDQFTAQLANGVLSPERNCLLAFTIELPESDPYVIEVGGLSETKRGAAIGTYNDGTRWMSVQFD